MQRDLSLLGRLTSLILTSLLAVSGALSQTPKDKPRPQTAKGKPTSAPAKLESHRPTTSATSPNLAKEPTLYVVGYAHLDTEWRWEYPQVISEYIRKTMEDNFKLFEKYPHYVFNFR